MSKKAIQTLIYSVSLGVAMLIAGYFSDGVHMAKILPTAFAMIFAGIVASLSVIIKGKKADREYDERENLIQEKSMKFSFYFTSFTIVTFWAYEVSILGAMNNYITYMLFLFWTSFLAAYAVNKFRY